MMNLDNHLDNFKQHLMRLKNLESSSAKRYLVVVLEFIKWHAEHAQDGLGEEITGQDIKDYLQWVESRRNGKYRCRFKFGALQAFFRYLVHVARVISSDPTADIGRPETSNDRPPRFTRDQVLRMFSQCDNTEKGLRDAVFLILGAFAGLRVDEIINLQIEQHVFDDGKCIDLNIIKMNSGAGNRTVLLWPAPSTIVRSLLIARLTQSIKKGDPLLTSYKKNGLPRGNEYLTCKACDTLLKTLARRAGIRKRPIKTDMLHATHAADLQRICGFGMSQIMERMGWTDCNSIIRHRKGEIRQEYDSLDEYWHDFPKTWAARKGVTVGGENADRGGALADE